VTHRKIINASLAYIHHLMMAVLFNRNMLLLTFAIIKSCVLSHVAIMLCIIQTQRGWHTWL